MNEEYLNFAKDIARKAKEIMLKYFNEEKEISYKEDNTVVTKVDKEINDYLINKVKEKYPNHSVDGEEKKFGDSEYKWICDPIDGTAMYARGIPVSVFSLALVINGKPELGIVYDPFTDSTYTAVKGKGAYKNNQKIHVNNSDLNDNKCFCNFDVWPSAEYDIFDVVKELGKKAWFVDLGSVIRASMCVANGEFCFTIFPGTIGKYCDIAAVKIIVEEAGGKVTDLFGAEQLYDQNINGSIISNGVTHNEIVSTVKKYLKNRLEG